MMLTAKGRYAVMAMVDIAKHHNGKPVSLSDIAERQGITVPYLEQIFSKLKQSGVVKSVRGPGGGYRLSTAARDISIADIVMAAEESIKMTRCDHHSKGCMGDHSRCLTHDLWDGLGRTIHAYLASISLEDMCHGDIGMRSVNDPCVMKNNVVSSTRECGLG